MIPRFRAWDKLNNEMYVVEQINLNRGEFESIGYGITFLRGADKVELMQSTGIRDMSNQEIFEGDVVKTTRFVGRADEVGGFYEYDKEFIGIVKQLEGSWVIDTGSDAVCLWTEIEENEIIGNIYENPELLEEKNETRNN